MSVSVSALIVMQLVLQSEADNESWVPMWCNVRKKQYNLVESYLSLV